MLSLCRIYRLYAHIPRLESEEGLKKFQSGELPAKDEEWHRLVPEAAREALGKKEVERQSVFFELFKAERDYVGDMEAVQEVRSPVLVFYYRQ